MNLEERKKTSYVFADIAKEAVEFFKLKNPPSESAIDTYRHKITKEAKNHCNQNGTSLFEETTFYYDKESGEELTCEEKQKREKEGIKIKTKNFFTKDQMMELLLSPPLYNYFKEKSESYEIRCSQPAQELHEEAQEMNRRYRQFLIENHLQDSPAPSVTEIEFSDKVNEIMLEAIFRRYFEPVNISKLSEDMNNVRNAFNGNQTVFSLHAEKRLRDGRNYYREKKEGAFEYVKSRIDKGNGSKEDVAILDYLKRNCMPAGSVSLQKIYNYVRDYYKVYYLDKLMKYLEEYYKTI